MSRAHRPLSEPGVALARSLIADLASLGHAMEVVDGAPLYSCAPISGSNRSFYREAHVHLHLAQLRAREGRIAQLEGLIGDRFIAGCDLDFAAIEPRLRPVDLRSESTVSARDRAIIEYVRLYQTVGSNMSVGRENAFILEDVGQPSTPVMGALVLASPRYFQPRRDEVLGWLTPTAMSRLSGADQARNRAIREAGLLRTMHVAICCALPPYSQLAAAKLLAVAPFTASVRDAFDARWSEKDGDPDLALITTTSSMGRTGTPFQDLRAALYFDPLTSAPRGEKWNRNARLYARVSDAHPWLSDVAILAPEGFANFRALVSAETEVLAAEVVGEGDLSEGFTESDLNRALRRIGLSRAIFRGNPIGVFLGAVDRESIEAVAAGRPRVARPTMSWNLAVRKFRRDFGVEPEPERKTGADWIARADAVRARRLRAESVTLADVHLSQRLERGVDDEGEREPPDPD